MSTRPISVGDSTPLIERAYAQSKQFQWVREAMKNSLESPSQGSS